SPGRELAMAYCNVSHLCMNIEDAAGTALWGERALELAQRIGDVEALVYAQINLGAMEIIACSPGGSHALEPTLELAQAAGLEEHAGRVFVTLTWWAPRGRSYSLADRYLEAGLEYCTERGLDLWRLYLLAYRARRDLDKG